MPTETNKQRLASARRRSIRLPVLGTPFDPFAPVALPADETRPQTTDEASPQTEPLPLKALPEGDPFNPHKILNHFDRVQALARGELVYPITVEIDPTNICNHRCQWCVSLEAHDDAMLSLERFRSLLDEAMASGVKSVVLKGGGEPSTHPQFLPMLDALRERRISTGLITNGSLPRRGSIDKILQTCEWVRVSLDAASAATHNAIHGSRDFQRIVANVGELARGRGDASTMIGLNFVAEPRNCHEMADFAALGKSLGVAYVTIRCVFDPANPLPEPMRQQMRAGARAARELESPDFRVFLGNFTDRYLDADRQSNFPWARCMGPNLVGIVGGDGEVYACCYLRGYKAFSFGNVNTQTFQQIWTSERRQQVMQAVYRGKCQRVCAGGMTANRYSNYNDILNYLAAEEKRHANFA